MLSSIRQCSLCPVAVTKVMFTDRAIHYSVDRRIRSRETAMAKPKYEGSHSVRTEQCEASERTALALTCARVSSASPTTSQE